MTLNFYLISTIISLILDVVMEKVYRCKEEAEKEGYKFIKTEKHKLRNLLFALDKIYCFIPIVNIITSIYFVMGYITEEYMYFLFGPNKVSETFIWSKIWAWEKQGKIYNAKEMEGLTSIYNLFAGAAAKKREDEKTMSKIKEEKTYDEMSNEEKLAFLQEEREKIMKSINSSSDSPSDEVEPPTSNNSISKTYTLKK